LYILGLNCSFFSSQSRDSIELPRWWCHDSAACLIKDGNVVAAVEQERLNRIKHTTDFAGDAIAFCLEQAGIPLQSVDGIAYYFAEDHMDKMLGRLQLAKPDIRKVSAREHLLDLLEARFGHRPDSSRVSFVDHHDAHIASVHYQSGFESSLVAVLDGSGERESSTIASIVHDKVEKLYVAPESASLGHFYSKACELVGYGLFDEYKVMGLAPYGDPTRFELDLSELYELAEDGQYSVQWEPLCDEFIRKGFVPRRPGEDFAQPHADFAASLQQALERIVVHILEYWRNATGHGNLSLAGGVAHNCSMNGALLRSGLFDKVFVHPASHDAGAALGAALSLWGRRGGSLNSSVGPVRHAFWGPGIGSPEEVMTQLGQWEAVVEYHRSTDLTADTARLLSEGEVVGWVQGRSEFGPRALGNRSILADPRPERNKDRINQIVKKREGYRPFAPAVKADSVATYFEVPDSAPNLDFMSFALKAKPSTAAVLGAVVHVDGTARVQAVDADVNPRFWDLIDEFEKLTGIPALVNTSFNNNAEPIVQSVEDALVCLLTTGLDAVVIGDWIVRRRGDADTALLSYRPRLRPDCRLESSLHRPTGSGPRQRFEVRKAHGEGKRVEVSATVFAALADMDGTRVLSDLLPKENAADVLATVTYLWSERFLSMRPRQADDRESGGENEPTPTAEPPRPDPRGVRRKA
jgi:predicted NodU family carbamoyl transferase